MRKDYPDQSAGGHPRGRGRYDRGGGAGHGASLAPEDRQDLRILKVGLVFQEFELLEYLDVLDNVLLPYRLTSLLELDDRGPRTGSRDSRTTSGSATSWAVSRPSSPRASASGWPCAGRW